MDQKQEKHFIVDILFVLALFGVFAVSALRLPETFSPPETCISPQARSSEVFTPPETPRRSHCTSPVIFAPPLTLISPYSPPAISPDAEQ